VRSVEVQSPVLTHQPWMTYTGRYVLPALLGRKEIADGAESPPERLDNAGPGLVQSGFQFCEGLLKLRLGRSLVPSPRSAAWLSTEVRVGFRFT
jgi:hypothetical protein